MALNFLFSYTNNTTLILDIVFCCLLTILIIGLTIKFYKKVMCVYIIDIALVLAVVAHFLSLELLSTLCLIIFLIIGLLFLFSNIGEFRGFFSQQQTNKKNKVQVKYNKEDFFRLIEETVRSLSKTKTGAIMTFERGTNLDDTAKTGSPINAPVTQELLETIFFPKTRLHDGAVVIRGNMIIAAAVFYTPTTRALNGKYGSRHRAALGISEISDSVTVVVSEETGRVSIAYKGELEIVSIDSFYREFSDYMS